ncbi:hypothetical protein EYF80_029261 [Liparis tanakae]|uniref:Uncharacterized protein n=1 Tax=Liparis tanakae TaxID=230148 RepID=A0A4Z2H3W2_9TELE|nr:hypothetical protein EYF80_029261 [Liparis tanakae]
MEAVEGWRQSSDGGSGGMEALQTKRHVSNHAAASAERSPLSRMEDPGLHHSGTVSRPESAGLVRTVFCEVQLHATLLTQAGIRPPVGARRSSSGREGGSSTSRSISRSLSQGGSHEDEEREGDGGKDIYDSDSGEAELNPNGCSFTAPNLSH